MNNTFRILLTGVIAFATAGTPAFAGPYIPQKPSAPSSLIAVNATPSKSAEAEISKLYYRSMSLIKRSAMSDADKEKKLQEVFSKYVDFTRMTAIAAGQHWKNATREQQAQLIREFRLLYVRDYMKALGAYQGAKLTITSSQKDVRPGDTEVLVTSYITTSGGQNVPVDWSKAKTADGFKVYDISLKGQRLSTAYRSEFNAVVRRNGIDGLIKALVDKNALARK